MLTVTVTSEPKTDYACNAYDQGDTNARQGHHWFMEAVMRGVGRADVLALDDPAYVEWLDETVMHMATPPLDTIIVRLEMFLNR